MWKTIRCYDNKGNPVEGEDGARMAAEHFGIREPRCPIVELEGEGFFAAWVAAPCEEVKSYPPLHYPPKDPSSPFAHVKVAPR